MAVLSYDAARRRSAMARQFDHDDALVLNWRLVLAVALNLVFWALILEFAALAPG